MKNILRTLRIQGTLLEQGLMTKEGSLKTPRGASLQQAVEFGAVVRLHQLGMEDGDKVFEQYVGLDRRQLIIRTLLHVAIGRMYIFPWMPRVQH